MSPSVLRNLFLLFTLITWTACGGDATRDVPSDKFAVRVRLEASAPILNPYLPTQGYARFIASNIYQTLSIVHPESLEMAPLLITEMPSLRIVDTGAYKGQYAYDFALNPAAAWDDGSPLTAKDVEFTLKIIMHPGLPTGIWRSYFEQVQALVIDPADPKKFTIYFTPYYMLALESMCQVPIFPSYLYDPEQLMASVPLTDLIDQKKAAELMASNPAMSKFATQFQEPKFANEPEGVLGSNAYRLGGFLGDNGLYLLRKENWWGDKDTTGNPFLHAYPDTIFYLVVKDDAALENKLKNEELDVAVAINPARFVEMKQDQQLARLYDFSTRWTPIYSRWLINMRNPVLSNKKVRQALAQIVDYDYLIGTVLQNMAGRTVGPISPVKKFYNKNITPYAFDVEKAKALLQEAGWTDTDGDGIADKVINGKKTPLKVDIKTTATSAISEQAVAMLVKNGKLAGIDVHPTVVDFNKLSTDTRNGQFETAILSSAMFTGLVELRQQYHSKSIGADNRSALANSELDRLIDAIRSTPDENERNGLYLKAQEILHDKVPEVFLYIPDQRYIVSKRFDYVLSSSRPGYYEALFKLKK